MVGPLTGQGESSCRHDDDTRGKVVSNLFWLDTAFRRPYYLGTRICFVLACDSAGMRLHWTAAKTTRHVSANADWSHSLCTLDDMNPLAQDIMLIKNVGDDFCAVISVA